MMRFLVVAGLALAISAQAARADELGDRVRGLYRAYETQGTNARPAADVIRPMASRRLAALLDQDKACSRKSGGVCKLDFDVIANGQDFEIKNVQVSPAETEGDKAAVTARFDNFDGKFETRYEFVREGGTWKLDDIEARQPADNRWRLSTVLSPQRAPARPRR